MFLPNSRYAAAGTYTIRTARGARIAAIQLPVRSVSPIRGVHPRTDAQRPDHVAAHYLADATAFWRLCDASEAIAPDALGARDAIAIPKKGG